MSCDLCATPGAVYLRYDSRARLHHWQCTQGCRQKFGNLTRPDGTKDPYVPIEVRRREAAERNARNFGTDPSWYGQ